MLPCISIDSEPFESPFSVNTNNSSGINVCANETKEGVQDQRQTFSDHELRRAVSRVYVQSTYLTLLKAVCPGL